MQSSHVNVKINNIKYPSGIIFKTIKQTISQNLTTQQMKYINKSLNKVYRNMSVKKLSITLNLKLSNQMEAPGGSIFLSFKHYRTVCYLC